MLMTQAMRQVPLGQESWEQKIKSRAGARKVTPESSHKKVNLRSRCFGSCRAANITRRGDASRQRNGRGRNNHERVARKSECAGTRTRDLRIKSPLLYRLSYAFVP
jgi:hypothetical protein